MTPISLLLADDHPLLRAGVRAHLRRMPGVHLVGEATDGAEAIDAVARARPDIMLLDISMRGTSGFDALREIVKRFPLTRVIMLTIHDEEEFVVRAMRSGASGYVLKDAEPAELLLAIETVHAGGTFVSPSLAGALAHYIQRPDNESPLIPALTPRQREVLRLIAESRHTKEIATALGISIKTVEMHRSALMSRLGIRDVAGLVRFAVRVGLVRPDR